MKLLLTILTLCLAAVFVRSATIRNRDGEGIAQTLEGRVSAEQLRAANGFAAQTTAPDLDITKREKMPDGLDSQDKLLGTGNYATSVRTDSPMVFRESSVGEVIAEVPAENVLRSDGLVLVRVTDEQWAEVSAAWSAAYPNQGTPGVSGTMVILGPPGYKRAKK